MAAGADTRMMSRDVVPVGVGQRDNGRYRVAHQWPTVFRRNDAGDNDGPGRRRSCGTVGYPAFP
jgi:hypothetical protein